MNNEQLINHVTDIANSLIEAENKAENGSGDLRLNYFAGIIKGLSLVIEPLGVSFDTNCVFIPFTSMEFGCKGRQWGLEVNKL